MFIDFFLKLREAKVPVSIKEYLALMEAMDKGVADYSVDDFYFLSRAVLVKDERNIDKFDRVFGVSFKGLEYVSEGTTAEIPEEWLKALAEKFLTEEEKAQIESLGGWEKLIETLKQRGEGGHEHQHPGARGLTPPSRPAPGPEGPARRVKLGRREIVFMRTTPRNMATAGRKSGTEQWRPARPPRLVDPATDLHASRPSTATGSPSRSLRARDDQLRGHRGRGRDEAERDRHDQSPDDPGRQAAEVVARPSGLFLRPRAAA